MHDGLRIRADKRSGCIPAEPYPPVCNMIISNKEDFIAQK